MHGSGSGGQSEAAAYKLVLKQIRSETEAMGQMHFESTELERDLMSAHNLKMSLYAQNVLSRFEPKGIAEDPG